MSEHLKHLPVSSRSRLSAAASRPPAAALLPMAGAARRAGPAQQTTLGGGHGRGKRRPAARTPTGAHRTAAPPAQRQARLQRRLGPPLRAGHEPVQRHAIRRCRPGPGTCPTRRPGCENITSLRPGQERRLHRHVHAVRADAVGERAVSVPDHAERRATSPSCSSRAPGSTSCRSRTSTRRTSNPTWFGDVDRHVGRRHAGRRHHRASTASPGSTPRATRTATSCTWRRRFTRTDAGHIAYIVTIDDPVYYTKPWTNERTFTLTNGNLMEYSCEENNRSLWEGRIKIWVPPGSNNPAFRQ